MADKAYLSAYKIAYPGLPLPEDKAFVENITVDHIKGSTLVNVMYTDKSPAVAEAAATAVLKTYQVLYGNTSKILGNTPKMEYDRAQVERLETDLAAKHREMDDLVRQAGGQAELADREANVEQHLYKDEDDLRAFQQTYTDAATAGHGAGDAELVYEQIAGTGDRQMIGFLDLRSQARQAVDVLLTTGVGTSAPRYAEADQALQQTNRRVDDYAHEFLTRHPGQIPGVLPNGGGGPTSLDVMKSRLVQMQATVDAEKAEAGRLAQAKQRVADVQGEIAHIDGERLQYATYNQKMTDTEALTQNIAITMPGAATLQGDRRKAMAAVGFLAGGLLPVAA